MKLAALDKVVGVWPPLLAGFALPGPDEQAAGVNPVLRAPKQPEANLGCQEAQ
jgi:hypothetical protein